MYFLFNFLHKYLRCDENTNTVHEILDLLRVRDGKIGI